MSACYSYNSEGLKYLKMKTGGSQAQWLMPVILALEGLRQEDCFEFDVCLNYGVRSCLAPPPQNGKSLVTPACQKAGAGSVENCVEAVCSVEAVSLGGKGAE